jgi:type IV secretory pathway VirB6-like protein
MLNKIKSSLLIIFASLLLLSALPIYFVVNYQKYLNVKAASQSNTIGSNTIEYVDGEYFEYKPTNDPFKNIVISTTSFTPANNSLFVRKGQKLLFNYKEMQNCGNIEIKTIPRPAVLCKGEHKIIKSNPKCSDYIEICQFKGILTGPPSSAPNNYLYKIKDPRDDFCISVVKICMPNVAEVCKNGNSYLTDALDGTTLKKASEILFSNQELCKTLPFYNNNNNIIFTKYCCTNTNCNTLQTKCSNNQEIVLSGIDTTQCATTSISNFEILKTDIDKKPIWSTASCSSTCPCLTKLRLADNNIAAFSYLNKNSDACYDLTDYTGNIENLPNLTGDNDYYYNYQAILNNGKKARSISPATTLSSDQPFGNLDYSNKNSIVVNEEGQLSNLPSFTSSHSNATKMKMLFVNNNNFRTFDQNSISTTITFNQTQTYQNGQMLKVILCQEDIGSAYPDPQTDRIYKPKYQENYIPKCENYFIPTSNIAEHITKTYNAINPPSSTMPTALTSNDFFAEETVENSVSPPITHQIGSVNILSKTIDVYDNSNITNRSAYMFNTDSALKFMVNATANRPLLSTIPSDKNEPTCYNYDRNFYCHTSFARPFDATKLEEWEAKQLQRDMSLRLAFQIDDPDLQKQYPFSSTLYPNAVYSDNQSEITKGNEAYNNNTGKYEVTVKVTNPAKKAQLAVTERLDEIVEILSLRKFFNFNESYQEDKSAPNSEDKSESINHYKTNYNIFDYLATNKQLKTLVTVSAYLMLSIFAIMYLMGLSKLDHQALVGMTLKIAFVFSLFQTDSWQFYHRFFAGPLISGFNEISYKTLTIFSPEDSARVVANIAGFEKAKISTYFYQSVDVITMLFNQKNHFKVMAIFFSYSYGFIYVFIIYYGFYIYLFATANAILMFLLAKIIMLLLINLLPLFLLCLFFKTTKKMLDNWFSVILGYGFQQIFIIITVAFFNIMIVYILKMILGYKVCWNSILKIPSGSLGSGIPFSDIVFFKFWQVNDGENGDYIPSLFHILYFLILVYAMKHFINFAATLGASIAGGISVEDLTRAISNDLNNNGASKLIKQRFTKFVGGMQERLLDTVSFGYSGKLADKRIENNNKSIDDSRQLFLEVQKELNKYKEQNKSDFLGKSDLEIKNNLEQKAKSILQKAGYDKSFKELSQDAKKWKASSSTTLPGTIFENTQVVREYASGRVYNAIFGKNIITGVENDTGNFSESDLINPNIPNISQPDINKKRRALTKELNDLHNQLATAIDRETIEQQIINAQMQLEFTNKNQKKIRIVKSLTSALKNSLVGLGVATTSAIAGGFAGVIAGSFYSRAYSSPYSGATNISNTISYVGNFMGMPRCGKVVGYIGGGLVGFIGGIGSSITGAAIGGIGGTVLGAVSGVRFFRKIVADPNNISSNLLAESNDFYQKINYTIPLTIASGARSAGVRTYSAGVRVLAGVRFVSGIRPTITRSRIASGARSAGIRTYSAGIRTYSAGVRVLAGVRFVSGIRPTITRSRIASGVRGASTALFGGMSSFYAAYNMASNIASNNSEYNLRETLTKHNVTKINQTQIINQFKKAIKKSLTKNLDLNNLKPNNSKNHYSNRELKAIHEIIENTISQVPLNHFTDREDLFIKFAKLAQAEQPLKYVSSAIEQITASSVGAVLVAPSYAAGVATQMCVDLHNQRQETIAKETINKFINSLSNVTEQTSIREIVNKPEWQNDLKNADNQTKETLIKEVISKTYYITDKVNLQIALEQFANKLQGGK